MLLLHQEKCPSSCFAWKHRGKEGDVAAAPIATGFCCSVGFFLPPLATGGLQLGLQERREAALGVSDAQG